MLDLAVVNERIKRLADANLKGAVVTSVVSASTINSMGQDALRVTIVLKEDWSGPEVGSSVLNAIREIGDDLQAQGEERMPIVEFATEAELSDDVDTES